MNINLEQLTIQDAHALFQFEKENRQFFESMVPSRGDHYYVFENFLLILEELLAEQEMGLSHFYLIKDDNKNIVGRINLVDMDVQKKLGFLGYRIGKDFIKKGLASKAVELLLQKSLGVSEILAKTTTDNYGSQKVLIKNGFTILPNGEDPGFIHYKWRSEQE
jgi:[ribosomal protein S5]-alanine N-acetyltransferase